jgi:hypothetical protein
LSEVAYDGLVECVDCVLGGGYGMLEFLSLSIGTTIIVRSVEQSRALQDEVF